MTRRKQKVAATRHAKNEWSFKRKALAVTLSIALLGLGTPAVSFADSAADQQSKAVEAQETTSTVSVQEQAPASAEPAQQVVASSAALGDAAVDNDVATDSKAEVDDAANKATVPASSENTSSAFSKDGASASASSDDPSSDKSSASTEASSKEGTAIASEAKDDKVNDQVNAASNEAVASAEYTVAIGESITIFGSGSLWESSWASEGTAATVTGNGNKATVTGVSAGDVTVTYTYKSVFFETRTETFVVHVVGARPKISIEGDLVVGGKIKFSVQNFENADAIQWASDNTEVATIDSGGVVEGISVGKANITASAGSESATKQIEVKRDESNGGYYVYLYTKVVGDTTDLTLKVNDNGWYTIGRVWVNGITDPANGSTSYVTSGDNYQKVMDALEDSSNVDLYGVNSIKLEDIGWSVAGQATGLKVASGAVDYDTSNKSTWHLDGYVDLDKVSFGSIRFHYKDADTDTTLADDETVTAKATEDEFDFSNYIISIEGYTYDHANPPSVKVTAKKTTEVTLYYKKGTANYTVYYKEKDTEKELASPKTATTSYGSTVTEDALDIRGYKVDGKSSQDLKIDAQNKSITFYYMAKQGKVGYYLADSSATWDAPADTVRTEDLKWYYNYGFAKDDTVQVTNAKPTATGKAFIGWLDEERGGQPAAIREAGDTITYIYSGNQSYTLDALWASLAVTGYKDTYDGKEHGLASVDIAINEGSKLDQKYREQAKDFIKQGTVQYSTDKGETWSDVAPKYKDAGTYPVKVKVDVTVAGQTTTLETTANIEIAKRDVTLRPADAEKPYDGSALTASEFEVAAGSFAEGEGVESCTYTGSQTLVGKSKSAIGSATALAGTNLKDNYNVKYEEGNLTVTDRAVKYAIEMQAKSGTATYNGQEQSASGFESDVFEFDGVKYAVSGLTATAKGTDAGTYESAVEGTAVVKDPEGNDVTAQFDVAAQPGELIITPAPYSVVTESATKVYDGTALTAGGKIEGLLEGETANLKVTGSQTKVGASENTYIIEWTGAAKESNYKLESESIGTLTVTAAPDSPTPDDQSKDQSVFSGANSGLVQTGDATGIYGVAAIIAAAVTAFVSLLAVRRRKE